MPVEHVDVVERAGRGDHPGRVGGHPALPQRPRERGQLGDRIGTAHRLAAHPSRASSPGSTSRSAVTWSSRYFSSAPSVARTAGRLSSVAPSSRSAVAQSIASAIPGGFDQPGRPHRRDPGRDLPGQPVGDLGLRAGG